MISAGDPKIPAKKVDGDRLAAHALGHESARMRTEADLARLEEEKRLEAAAATANEVLANLAGPRPDPAKVKKLLGDSSKGGFRASRFSQSAADVVARKSLSVEERIAGFLTAKPATDEEAYAQYAALKALVTGFMMLS